MKVVFNPNEGTYTNVSYKSRNNNHDSEKKVVAGGGAIAASKSGLDMFSSTKKVTNTTKAVGEVAKKSKGLMAYVVKSANWLKNAILDFRETLGKIKFLRPFVNSKLFTYCARALGYGFGAVTLIAGLADIGKATTETLERNFSQNA